MRVVFIIFIILHALIHLLGFTKAFGFLDIKQLSQPISRTAGAAWLVAFVLLLTAAVLFALRNSYWWIVAFPAIILSQVLLISCWQDAKFGTSLNLIILLAVIAGYAATSFQKKYQNDVKNGLHQKLDDGNSILSERDMRQLPEAVKRYLRLSGSVGKPKVNNFRIEFIGEIRKNNQSAWMPFKSEQYNFMEKPTRLFFMKAVMKCLPVAGYHCFVNGDAFMDIRLMSLLKVQFMDGAEIDTAETVTFFNDMCCMAPATLIDKRILWEEVSENKVSAQFTNNGISIKADLYFNQTGELINFISNDRYAADAGKKLPWSTPLKKYKEISGHRLASEAEALYAYPDGNLCYGRFEIAAIQYNCVDMP